MKSEHNSSEYNRLDHNSIGAQKGSNPELLSKIIVLLILLATLLVGCSSIEKIEQAGLTDYIPLNSESKIGQTFVARYDGLDSISLILRPGSNAAGTLVLNLRPGPESNDNLVIAAMPLHEVTSERTYRIEFQPQADSYNEYYYVLLKIQGPGNVEVGYNQNGDSYLNGALYQNHNPLDAQMTFNLSYNRRWAIIGLLKEGITWIGWILISIFLYVIPGWALLCILWSKWSQLHWAEKLGLAGGLSLAMYPLLILWTSLVGLRLGALYAWLPPLIGSGILIWQHFKDLKTFPRTIRDKFTHLLHSPTTILAELALIIVVVLIVLTRFWAVRGLDAPMWGDSYQHTMIAQLLVDNKGLFNSWQPYAEMTTFTYHFGFHSFVSIFHWITRLPMHKATLIVGQIINIMAVIFLFPLAMRIKRNVWGGTITLLVAGLLVPMPMYYVNWGRYTQLAGQAILPALVYFAWAAMETNQRSWRLIILTWLSLAGLVLTHYRVIIFAVLFFCAYFLLNLFQKPILKQLLRIFIVSAGAAILATPWLFHIFLGRLPIIASTIIQETGAKITNNVIVADPIGDPKNYLPLIIWLILPLILSWRLWSRDRNIALVGIWWYLIYVVANPHMIELPGTRLITNFTIYIAAYFPASLVIGSAVSNLVENHTQTAAQQNNKSLEISQLKLRWSQFLLLIVIISLSLWGARDRLWDVDPPSHAMVTRPDMRAYNWIKTTTAATTAYLINSFLIYGNSAIVGADGGWWLPILANRQVNVPPLNYTSEQGPDPNYHQWIIIPTIEIQNKGITHPDVLALLKNRNITHIYLGQQQGSVNNNNVIDPQALSVDPHFTPVYHQDQVWIFEIDYPE